MKAEIILRSRAIFTSLTDHPQTGYVAMAGNKIIAVGTENEEHYHTSETEIIDLGEQLICPGFVDTHCFFTGYLLSRSGVCLSSCSDQNEVTRIILDYQQTLKPGSTVIGRALPQELFLSTELLNEHFGDIPVILFGEEFDTCCMNQAAADTFDFTPDTCWSESYWKLLRYLLADTEHSIPEYQKYLEMMNSRGITTMKEMGFDDFYGFTDVIEKLKTENTLTARVHFMSQPVGAPMDLQYGREMRDRFHDEFACFSGYNQMTDGSISQLEGEMKEPYLAEDTCCRLNIAWGSLKQDTLAADQEGFRFSLHAQGDGAISKVIDIYDECQKKTDGTLLNRHAITDLECSDPKDLERMGRLKIVGEIYPQIMSLASRGEKTAMINHTIGEQRGANYWNRRKMADCEVVLSCATDLPLLFDDIPESIYHSVYGYFPEGGEPFNSTNTLTITELLKAWTIGGQYNLGLETVLGTLEEGKIADISVLDANVFQTTPKDLHKVKVSLTMVNGKIVYRNI